MSDDRRPNVYGVSRDLWDHPMFADEAYTEKQAWAWLIGAAAWKAIHTRGNAGPVHLKRGEFSFSVRFLAEKWKWKKDRVARFMTRLKKRDMVSDTERDGCQIYSINNYNKFQVVALPKRDSDHDTERDTTATAPRQTRDKEETGETGEALSTSSLRSDDGAREAEPFVPEPKPKPPSEPNSADQAFDLYDEFASRNGWTRCQRRSSSRVSRLRKRLAEAGGIDGVRAALEKAEASDWCCGRAPPRDGQTPFLFHIDFLLQESSFTKLMEGRYDNRTSQARRDTRFGRVIAAASALADRDDGRGDNPELWENVDSPRAATG